MPARKNAGIVVVVPTTRIAASASAGSVIATSPIVQCSTSCWAARRRSRRSFALVEVDVVGDDDDDHPPVEVSRHVGEQAVNPRRLAVEVDAVVDRAQQPFEVEVVAPWRDVHDVLAVGDVGGTPSADRSGDRPGDEADGVAVAGGDVADRPGGEHGDVALRARGVGERRHRPAGVDDEQHGVPARRHVALDQRTAGAGGRLPVDVLDVVAEHVLAEVVEVHAAATMDRAVLAVDARPACAGGQEWPGGP